MTRQSGTYHGPFDRPTPNLKRRRSASFRDRGKWRGDQWEFPKTQSIKKFRSTTVTDIPQFNQIRTPRWRGEANFRIPIRLVVLKRVDEFPAILIQNAQERIEGRSDSPRHYFNAHGLFRFRGETEVVSLQFGGGAFDRSPSLQLLLSGFGRVGF